MNASHQIQVNGSLEIIVGMQLIGKVNIFIKLLVDILEEMAIQCALVYRQWEDINICKTCTMVGHKYM